MFTESRTVFMPLGAGAEVGRSCMYVQHGDAKLLLDIGVHPAHSGVCGLPFLDLIDLSTVDACFVTHFHLDHAGALPYLTEKTAFKGRVYMTHPTRAILKYLLNDYARVVNAASEKDFYSEDELQRCYEKITPIDYDQEVVVKGLRVVASNAGHVLGAAMFLLKTSKTLLYTGDYSTEPDRHLRPAVCPGRVDLLVCEATYGTQCHLPRAQREQRFLRAVEAIVARRGRALLPVFALGRAQELLLILDEHWAAHPRLHGVPVLYCSALARRCIGVYHAYAASASGCSFDLRHVESVSDVRDPPAPCVVLASPGMLQTGLSRRLFEKWCSDRRNGVVLAGYAVQGTLAKELLSAPSDVASLSGARLQVACSVDAVSFSAHVDFPQNASFIRECDPAALFLVHGEGGEMLRLAAALKRDHIYSLRNGECAEVISHEAVPIRIPRLPPSEHVTAAIIADTSGLRACLPSELRPVTVMQVASISNYSQYIDPVLKDLVTYMQEDVFHTDSKNLNTSENHSKYLEPSNSNNLSDENITSHNPNNHLQNSRSSILKMPKSELANSSLSENIDKEDIHASLSFDPDSEKHTSQEFSSKVSDYTNLENKPASNLHDNQNYTSFGNLNHHNEGTLQDSNVTCLSVDDGNKGNLLALHINNEKEQVSFANTPEQCTSFIQLPFNAKLSLIKNILHDHFPQITITRTELKLESITIHIQDDQIQMKWASNYINDLLAQTISHILKNLQTTKLMKLCDEGERETLLKFLKNRYTSIKEEGPCIHVIEGSSQATINNWDVYGTESLCIEICEILDTVRSIFSL